MVAARGNSLRYKPLRTDGDASHQLKIKANKAATAAPPSVDVYNYTLLTGTASIEIPLESSKVIDR